VDKGTAKWRIWEDDLLDPLRETVEQGHLVVQLAQLASGSTENPQDGLQQRDG
jgi:hypothetical protein